MTRSNSAARLASRSAAFLAGAILLQASAAVATPPVVVGIPGPAGESAVAFTLDRCLDEAVTGNLDLQRIRLREREISGQGMQAIATGLPTLDVITTWTRSRDPSFLLDDSFGGSGDDGGSELPDSLPGGFDFSSFLPTPDELDSQVFWRGNLSSDWEVNPFLVWNAMGGVDATRGQFDEDVRGEEHRVAEETIRTFHETILHQETVAALDAEIAARQEFLDIARRRFELELSTELDTLQAAVALANLRPERRGAATNLRNATSRLNLLMGREALDPLTLLPVAELENDRIETAAALDAVGNRPDLRSADWSIRFLQKRRGVERADRKPFLSANGTYGWVARDLDDLVGREYEAWQASVSLILPIFDGFQARGRTRELDAQIDALRRSLQDARRRARLEVATTLAELEAARENHAAAELNVKAAEKALEQTTLRYEVGKSEYLSVLNAQSDRFAARSHLIEARYDVLSQTAALKRAIGVNPRTPLARIRAELEGSTK